MIISLLLLVLIWTLPNQCNKIFTQRPQSQLLKFIAALLVVFGHQTLFYCNTSAFIKSETVLGDLCVAFFLFMSGYGLLYGYLNKGVTSLSDNWFIKHITKLAIPALTAMILYTAAKVCIGQTIDWQHLLAWWFISNTNLPYGWYVSEIIILYIGFYICFRYVKSPYSLPILCLAIVSAMGIMIVLKAPVWYIKGLPCFLIGMFLAKHDAKEKSSSHKIKPIRMKLIITMCIIIFYLLKDFYRLQELVPFLDRWRYTYMSFYLIDIAFIFIIGNVLMRIPLCNKMLNGGGYFYEIYLVQGATLLVCRETIPDDMAFIIIGLSVTAIVAKWMNALNKRISNLLLK